MLYVVCCTMNFKLHGATDEWLVLRDGDVVQGVDINSCPTNEQRTMRQRETDANKRRSPSEPIVRLFWFRALGVTRQAVAGAELRPTRRRRPTIPAELPKPHEEENEQHEATERGHPGRPADGRP